MNQPFVITRVVLDLIIAHARETQPAECCGILLGRDHDIVEAVRMRNIATEPTRYLLDPKEHIDTRRSARERGLDVLGFYHSHPHSAPEPSASDVAEASYPDHVYLIVSLRDDGRGRGRGPEDRAERPAGARAFSLGNGVSTEVALEVTQNRGIEESGN